MLEQDVNKPLNGRQIITALVILFLGGIAFQNFNLLVLEKPWLGILAIGLLIGVSWKLLRRRKPTTP